MVGEWNFKIHYAQATFYSYHILYQTLHTGIMVYVNFSNFQRNFDSFQFRLTNDSSVWMNFKRFLYSDTIKTIVLK